MKKETLEINVRAKALYARRRRNDMARWRKLKRLVFPGGFLQFNDWREYTGWWDRPYVLDNESKEPGICVIFIDNMKGAHD